VDPVAACPHVDEHLALAREAVRVERAARRLRRRMGRRGEDLVSRFDAVIGVLDHWEYVDGWNLSARGRALRHVYSERDLLLTEAVLRGLLEGLTPPELAAVASVFTFEPRAADIPGGWPTPDVEERCSAIGELWLELNRLEAEASLPETTAPETGFAEIIHGWAAGLDLDDLFGEDEFAAGDFVRNCRQLLDLLRQLRDAFPDLAQDARSAIAVIDRGIVAAGGRW
jgi:ATP-dependent RNA helicase HelY